MNHILESDRRQIEERALQPWEYLGEDYSKQLFAKQKHRFRAWHGLTSQLAAASGFSVLSAAFHSSILGAVAAFFGFSFFTWCILHGAGNETLFSFDKKRNKVRLEAARKVFAQARTISDGTVYVDIIDNTKAKKFVLMSFDLGKDQEAIAHRYLALKDVCKKITAQNSAARQLMLQQHSITRRGRLKHRTLKLTKKGLAQQLIDEGVQGIPARLVRQSADQMQRSANEQLIRTLDKA